MKPTQVDIDSGDEVTSQTLGARRGTFLPFAQPSISEDDIAAVGDVLRSGWLTSGPLIRKFEQEFASELGGGAVVAVSSGTAAMHVALKALNVPEGSWVITTPLTFCSTAHVIEQIGCHPLFVDVEPDTLNIDPAGVEAALAEGKHRVAAILPVHYAGHPVELDRILQLADQYDLPVLEDAAHAFGAAFRGTPIGQVGDDQRRAVAFSLYATKNITSGEGGMLAGSEPVVRQARLWSLNGMSRDSWGRYGPKGSWQYEVLVPGFKYNMSDIQAALGRSQLSRWREFQRRRTDIAARYDELLSDVSEIELPKPRAHVTPAWHLYPIRLRLEALTIDRAEFIEQLRLRNIGTSVHFIPLHLQPYYRDRYGLERDAFPIAAREYERLVSLPIYPRMTEADVEDVVAAVRDTVAKHLRAAP